MKRCKLIKCWTDYPMTELGDVSGQKAPIRHVTVQSYDGNKYVHVITDDGHETSFKAGYLYRAKGRYGDVKHVNPRKISRMINVRE